MTLAAGRKHSGKGEETRARILKASAELFLEQGYEKTTARQIAMRSGVLVGSIYNLFDGKDGIFKEVVMEALWESVRESEKYLDESMGFIQRLSFPICLLLYASSKSPRIAEIISTANKNWTVMESVADSMTEWIQAKDEEHILPAEDEAFRTKIYASVGGLGTIVERMEHHPGIIDPRDAAHVVCKTLAGMFDLKADDIDGTVDKVYGILEENTILICGITV